MRTILALAVVLAAAGQAAAETFTFTTGTITDMGDAAPLTVTFQLVKAPVVDNVFVEASATVPDYLGAGDPPWMLTIDETNAAAHGIADWSTFAALPQDDDWHRMRVGIASFRGFATPLEFPYIQDDPQFRLVTFTIDHIDLELVRYDAGGNHRVELFAYLTGEGVAVPEPSTAVAALLGALALMLPRSVRLGD
jgi:hypothetical protein